MTPIRRRLARHSLVRLSMNRRATKPCPDPQSSILDPPPCPTPTSRPCSPTALAGRTTARGPKSTSSRRSSAPSGRPLAEHPERTLVDFGIGENDEMAPPQVRRQHGRRDQPAREPRLRRQRHRRVPRSRRPVHAADFRRHARPRHGGQSLHRLEAGPGDAAGLLHQSRRRHADDRARLPRRRHAHAILRRHGLRAAPPRRERFLPRPRIDPRRHPPAGEAARHQLPQQPDRPTSPRASSTSASSISPKRTRSSSSRTPPTAC